MARSNLKAPGRCIFCGDQGLTKEHIWADWLRPYLPYGGSSAAFGTGRRFYDARGNPADTHSRKNRPGNIHSHKLRVVCAACNNGWMSRMQSAAKPILIPLLLEESNGDELTDDDRKILSAWATMFTIVVEQADPNTMTVDTEARKAFSLNPEPFPDWMIWIGRAVETAWRYNHIGWKMLPNEASDTDRKAATTDSQVTFFRVGALWFQTYSSPLNDLNIDSFLFALEWSLVPLWPKPAMRFGGIVRTLSGPDTAKLCSYVADLMDPNYKFSPGPLSEHRALGGKLGPFYPHHFIPVPDGDENEKK